MDNPTVPHLAPGNHSILQEAVALAHLPIQPERSLAERRKRDLVALADFGARTGRRWLVRDALLAMRREGLMTPALAHILPTAVMNDPTSYLAEALRGDECWVVAEAYDALRLESYGFPALAVEDQTALTLEHLHGCRWVILLQRPGEEQTLAGLDVRDELLRLGWAGTLTSIILPFVDLDVAEQECGGARFETFLVSLLLQANSQQLGGVQLSSVSCTVQTVPAQTLLAGGAIRTIAAQEVAAWRK